MKRSELRQVIREEILELLEADDNSLRKQKSQLRDNLFKLNSKIYDLKARDQENISNGRPRQFDHFIDKLQDQADSYRKQLKNLPKYNDL